MLYSQLTKFTCLFPQLVADSAARIEVKKVFIIIMITNHLFRSLHGCTRGCNVIKTLLTCTRRWSCCQLTSAFMVFSCVTFFSYQHRISVGVYCNTNCRFLYCALFLWPYFIFFVVHKPFLQTLGQWLGLWTGARLQLSYKPCYFSDIHYPVNNCIAKKWRLGAWGFQGLPLLAGSP